MPIEFPATGAQLQEPPVPAYEPAVVICAVKNRNFVAGIQICFFQLHVLLVASSS
jgi:hypothetical protein